MMTFPETPAHRDPHIVQLAHRALAELSKRCPSLTVAVVTTDDGFEVARVLPESPDDAHGQRLASMTSTLQALGEAISRDLRLGTMSHVAIAGEGGSLLVRRIGELPFSLAAVFAPASDSDARATRAVIAGLAAALSNPPSGAAR